MTRNETSRRLTAAAGAFERALARLDSRPRKGDEVTAQKAGEALADALADYAGTLDRVEAGNIYRLTDEYGEKSFQYLTTGACQAKGLRTVAKVDDEGKCTFRADTAKADAFHDAATEMIVAARTIADRISHVRG